MNLLVMADTRRWDWGIKYSQKCHLSPVHFSQWPSQDLIVPDFRLNSSTSVLFWETLEEDLPTFIWSFFSHLTWKRRWQVTSLFITQKAYKTLIHVESPVPCDFPGGLQIDTQAWNSTIALPICFLLHGLSPSLHAKLLVTSWYGVLLIRSCLYGF